MLLKYSTLLVCSNRVFYTACTYIMTIYYAVIIDINECAEYNGGCQHNCTNANGSYSCSCRAGYKLTDDDHNCTENSLCDKLSCPLITKITALFLMCMLTGRQSTIIIS